MPQRCAKRFVGITPRILTSVLDEDKWPHSCPDRFTRGYITAGKIREGNRGVNIWFLPFEEEYLDLRKAKANDGGENYVTSSFMICIIHSILSRLCDACHGNYTQVPHCVIFFRLLTLEKARG
jgi:hypothetical protein